MGKKLIKVMIFGIIVFILVWIIFLIGNPKGPVLYNKPIMIMNKESNEIPIQIYNYKNKFLILSEYETILSYSKEDKILGTNKYKEISNLDGKQYSLQRLNNLILLETKQIDMTRGFFFKETDFKKQEDKGSIKRIYWYNQEKDPSKIGYIFTIPKNKPYFKVQLFAETKNNKQQSMLNSFLYILGEFEPLREKLEYLTGRRVEWSLRFTNLILGTILIILLFLNRGDAFSNALFVILSTIIIFILFILEDYDNLKIGDYITNISNSEQLFDLIGTERYYPEFVLRGVKLERGKTYRIGIYDPSAKAEKIFRITYNPKFFFRVSEIIRRVRRKSV